MQFSWENWPDLWRVTTGEAFELIEWQRSPPVIKTFIFKMCIHFQNVGMGTIFYIWKVTTGILVSGDLNCIIYLIMDALLPKYIEYLYSKIWTLYRWCPFKIIFKNIIPVVTFQIGYIKNCPHPDILKMNAHFETDRTKGNRHF